MFNTASTAAIPALQCPQVKGIEVPVADIGKWGIVKDSGHSTSDTGSPEAQVALLTAHINELQPYLKAYMRGHHNRHGLLCMVSRRRRLLDYLKNKDADHCITLIAKLGLRK